MATTTQEQSPAADEKAAGGGKSRLILIVVVVLALLGAGWWFFLRGGGDGEPKPGEVVTLEPVQVNLTDGHFLRIGIALQLVEGAHEIDGARALDATIAMFSGRSTDELIAGKARDRLKSMLLKRLEEFYEHAVMDIYFTEFVMQ